MRTASEPRSGPGPESGLRHLVEQLPALAWATDLDLRILWVIGAGFRALDPASMAERNLRDLLRESENFDEALVAHRHAQARLVQIELAARDRSLLLTVRDNGKGFDARAALRRAAQGHSQGLLGMKERVALAGGEIEIDSAEGRGTVVHARLPLPEGA